MIKHWRRLCGIIFMQMFCHTSTHSPVLIMQMSSALHYKALENGWMCGTLPAVFTLPHNCQDSSHSLTSATKTFANSDNWLGHVSLNPDALSKRPFPDHLPMCIRQQIGLQLGLCRKELLLFLFSLI